MDKVWMVEWSKPLITPLQSFLFLFTEGSSLKADNLKGIHVKKLCYLVVTSMWE